MDAGFLTSLGHHKYDAENKKPSAVAIVSTPTTVSIVPHTQDKSYNDPAL
jgi:hypothetical protein